MIQYPIFLSVVLTVKNQNQFIEQILTKAVSKLSTLVSDYEIIVIDNASNDNSLKTLKLLTDVDGLPNIQVFALTQEVSTDMASSLGLESALGDFVVIIDPLTDSLDVLELMLEKALAGIDVVFVSNIIKTKQSFLYRIAHNSFNFLYKKLNGVDLHKDAPPYRLLSRKVVNFILQHSQPDITYRYLPATAGFSRENIEYSENPLVDKTKQLKDGVDRAIKLLVSTTHLPMRIVTTLSFFGAIANLVYSLYVLIIALFKTSVAPGWVSLSLQQSGMFFLLSLVLLVLGEYILHMTRLSNETPPYHVAQEFTSSKMTRLEKLNLEVVQTSGSNAFTFKE